MLTFFLTQDKARKEKEAKVRAEQERKEREEAAAREREEEKRRQKEMEQVGPRWLLSCCVYVTRREYCRLGWMRATLHVARVWEDEHIRGWGDVEISMQTLLNKDVTSVFVNT
jgi:hypothetical protein